MSEDKDIPDVVHRTFPNVEAALRNFPYGATLPQLAAILNSNKDAVYNELLSIKERVEVDDDLFFLKPGV